MPSCAAVMLSFRRPQVVLQGLGNLVSMPDAPQRIFLVDNSPGDGSVDQIRKQFPAVVILDGGGNLGFATGNNLGMQKALAEGFEFVLLLNDDAQLLPGSLDLLMETMRSDETIGAIAPLIYYGDGEHIWSA